MKHFIVEKMLTWLVLYSRKEFRITLPTFSRSGCGNSISCIFVEGVRCFHGISLTYTKLFDCNSQGIITLLVSTVFNRKETEVQLKAKLILPHG